MVRLCGLLERSFVATFAPNVHAAAGPVVSGAQGGDVRDDDAISQWGSASTMISTGTSAILLLVEAIEEAAASESQLRWFAGLCRASSATRLSRFSTNSMARRSR